MLKILSLLILFTFFCFSGQVYAQEVYGPVQRAHTEGWVVMELFSSQACVFCPKADALMQGFSEQEKMIVLSCHVDYFDVKEGSLAIPACSARQNAYEASLRAGPKYTPEMVLNGKMEVVGYKMAEIVKKLEMAAARPILPLKIMPKTKVGAYRVQLPDYSPAAYKVWFVLFEKPRTLTVQDGMNKEQEMTYYNLVTDIVSLVDWGGIGRSLDFEVYPKEHSAGFALLVQDSLTMDIILADKILF